MKSSEARRPSGAPKNARVLQISDDPNLAITRLLLLHNYGYQAEHFFSSQMPNAAMSAFDIFLICQSIAVAEAAKLAHRIRCEAPLARILRVRNTQSDLAEFADITLAPPAGPWDLVRALASLDGSAPPPATAS